jgi:hypothetical protein
LEGAFSALKYLPLFIVALPMLARSYKLYGFIFMNGLKNKFALSLVLLLLRERLAGVNIA